MNITRAVMALSLGAAVTLSGVANLHAAEHIKTKVLSAFVENRLELKVEIYQGDLAERNIVTNMVFWHVGAQ